MSTDSSIPVPSPARSNIGPIRQVIEFFACLLLLVTLCRGFLVEGYLIETGSMAPSLLGVHKRASCPTCDYSFAVDDHQSHGPAVCPNCGQEGVSVDQLIRNEGDQLLVERCAFDVRRPRRWEVVVFRNPAKPTQAYVKRLVAFPGEEVQIRSGDIYVSGRIQTKSLEIQRGLRIPVYDHDYQPPAEDKQWRPRWIPDADASRWQVRGTTFFFDGMSAHKDELKPGQIQWIQYRHWVRQTSQHTTVPLERWPGSASLPAPPLDFLKFDAKKKLLTSECALPESYRDQLLSQSQASDFQKAITDLYEASHIASIGDVYGYNRTQEKSREVRDLMFVATVHIEQGTGQFLLGISDGKSDLNCVFDVAEKQVRLVDAASGKVLQSAELPSRMLESAVEVEFSLMDQQALVAVAGRQIFDPWQAPADTSPGNTAWRPVRFGAVKLDVELSHVRLYRDVYYTPGSGRRGADAPYLLQPGEYFALGDNSPNSRDSRSWTDGNILTEQMFIGKPFLVHLPSKRQRLKIGGWTADIRIPDFSRIHYIH